MATILMLDGFEHGRSAGSVGGIYDSVVGSPAMVTTPVRTGLRALEVSAAGAAEHATYNIAAGNRIVTQAVYLRFATLPTADVQLMDFNIVTSGKNGKVYFQNSTDQIAVRIGTGALVAGGPTLVVDTWYRVVVEYDSSAATLTIRATVDNGTEFSQTLASAAEDQTAVRLGTPNADTYTGYFDDWLISVTDGDYEDIGGWTSHRVESLIPNSDGTHNIAASGDFDSNSSTAFSNSTTNGYTFIDHRPLLASRNADDCIKQDVSGTTRYMEFGNENLATNSDPVDAVRTYATHNEFSTSGASLAEARLLLADDTEVLTTGSLSAINSTEDPGTTVTIRRRMTIAPSGGWDGTKVDGLKWRIGFGDAAPVPYFIDLMVEVAQHVAGGAVDGTASPATVAAVASIPAPAVGSDNTASPATVAGVGGVPAPTARGAAGVTPATVAALGDVPAPTASGGGAASVTPATVAAVGSVPAATARGAASVAPATVAATGGVPAPTARGAAIASPATVVGIGGVPAPTVRGGAIITPGTVVAVGGVPAPSASGGTNATASPSTTVAVATIPAPTVTGTARVTPSTVAGVSTVPTPAAGSSRTITPATVAAVSTVPSPTVRGGAIVTPATVAAIVTIPMPTFPGQLEVFISEGDADALLGMESDAGAASSLEGGVLIGTGLES